MHLKPAIETVSGSEFNYLDAKDPLTRICAFDIATGLSNTCRFAGQMTQFYSVAQHCVYAVQVAQMIPSAMGSILLEQIALLHDASEAYMQDIPSPLKQLLPDYQRLQHQVEQRIYHYYGLDKHLANWTREMRTIDLCLLKTEQLALRGPCDWDLLKNVDRLNVAIEPWSPTVAKAAWLQEFRRLFPNEPFGPEEFLGGDRYRKLDVVG